MPKGRTGEMKISFERAYELVNGKEKALMVDVREEEEYITGHAVDALLFPVDEIEAESAAMLLPDKDKALILYCRSGRRSAEAVEKLRALGYTKLYDVGSLIGWPYGTE